MARQTPICLNQLPCGRDLEPTQWSHLFGRLGPLSLAPWRDISFAKIGAKVIDNTFKLSRGPLGAPRHHVVHHPDPLCPCHSLACGHIDAVTHATHKLKCRPSCSFRQGLRVDAQNSAEQSQNNRTIQSVCLTHSVSEATVLVTALGR